MALYHIFPAANTTAEPSANCRDKIPLSFPRSSRVTTLFCIILPVVPSNLTIALSVDSPELIIASVIPYPDKVVGAVSYTHLTLPTTPYV